MLFLGASSYQASTVALLSCKEMFNFSVEDYQELTKREENDLEYMISQTENAISNIEAFTEQLSRDLSVLDGVIELAKLILSNYYYCSISNHMLYDFNLKAWFILMIFCNK